MLQYLADVSVAHSPHLADPFVWHVQAPKPVPEAVKQGVESVSDKGVSAAPGDSAHPLPPFHSTPL